MRNRLAPGGTVTWIAWLRSVRCARSRENQADGSLRARREDERSLEDFLRVYFFFPSFLSFFSMKNYPSLPLVVSGYLYRQRLWALLRQRTQFRWDEQVGNANKVPASCIDTEGCSFVAVPTRTVSLIPRESPKTGFSSTRRWRESIGSVESLKPSFSLVDLYGIVVFIYCYIFCHNLEKIEYVAISSCEIGEVIAFLYTLWNYVNIFLDFKDGFWNTKWLILYIK